MNQPRWDVLAATITAAMRDLNMRQADLVRESGLSLPTIRSFISGQLRADHPFPHTIRRLEEGLCWPAGAVDRILAGEDPDRVLETEAEVIPIDRPARSLSPELLAELEARFAPLSLAVEGFGRLALLSDQLAEMSRRLERLEAAIAAAKREAPPTPQSSTSRLD